MLDLGFSPNNITGDGSAVVGGWTTTTTIAGKGAVVVSGNNANTTIGGNGCVVVSGGICTVGRNEEEKGSILIGGSNTNIYSSNVVCIGASTQTQTFGPLTRQTLFKGNPLYGLKISSYTSSSTVGITEFGSGFITATPGLLAGITLTLPSASSLYNEMVDNTGGAFGLNMAFNVLVRNASIIGPVVLSAGTGMTLQGTTTLLVSSSVMLLCVFLSPTTMYVKAT